MRFSTPRNDRVFEIPDEWWSFVELNSAVPRRSEYYPYWSNDDVQIVPLSEIEPPQRVGGLAPFKKYKLVPVLLAFQSPECDLPPIQVTEQESSDYRFRVMNGFHRFYSSVAAGYSHIPVIRAPNAL